MKLLKVTLTKVQLWWSVLNLRILFVDSIRSQYPSSTARKLAQFVGKIISTGFVFGNITLIMTRYSHFDILRSPT